MVRNSVVNFKKAGTSPSLVHPAPLSHASNERHATVGKSGLKGPFLFGIFVVVVVDRTRNDIALIPTRRQESGWNWDEFCM